jgi:hypothetical protein
MVKKEIDNWKGVSPNLKIKINNKIDNMINRISILRNNLRDNCASDLEISGLNQFFDQDNFTGKNPSEIEQLVNEMIAYIEKLEVKYNIKKPRKPPGR